MDILAVFIIAIVAAGIGLALGWLLAGREAGRVREELAAARVNADQVEHIRRMHQAVETERDEHLRALTDLRARHETQAEAHAAQLRTLTEAKEALSSQFAETGAQLLEAAQRQFLERADARFKQSEETAGQGLKALLQPVHERLTRYEETVTKVEAERRDAFGLLTGQIESMRADAGRVSTEAANLVSAFRHAPKTRGSWGEQQLRNVLETCGLAEHTDFEMEVSVGGEDGSRLRPDAVVRIPGGKVLVIDSKVSFNAYQDAMSAVDDDARKKHLKLHHDSMRAHINSLGNKAYFSQFPDAPDYVIMFVGGEHFLSAALEHDSDLWNYAFERRVLLATPTNLVAIARTVSAVWQQETLAKEARQIGELGKELYERLAKAANDLRKVGSGLTSAVSNYNSFVASFETRALVTARKFRDLKIDTGAREIEDVVPVEALPRYGDGVSEGIFDSSVEAEGKG